MKLDALLGKCPCPAVIYIIMQKKSFEPLPSIYAAKKAFSLKEWQLCIISFLLANFPPTHGLRTKLRSKTARLQKQTLQILLSLTIFLKFTYDKKLNAAFGANVAGKILPLRFFKTSYLYSLLAGSKKLISFPEIAFS